MKKHVVLVVSEKEVQEQYDSMKVDFKALKKSEICNKGGKCDMKVHKIDPRLLEIKKPKVHHIKIEDFCEDTDKEVRT